MEGRLYLRMAAAWPGLGLSSPRSFPSPSPTPRDDAGVLWSSTACGPFAKRIVKARSTGVLPGCWWLRAPSSTLEWDEANWCRAPILYPNAEPNGSRHYRRRNPHIVNPTLYAIAYALPADSASPFWIARNCKLAVVGLARERSQVPTTAGVGNNRDFGGAALRALLLPTDCAQGVGLLIPVNRASGIPRLCDAGPWRGLFHRSGQRALGQ